MEAWKKQGAVFLELRERLQSGLLIIRNDVVKDASEVNVSSGDSALKIHIPDGIYEVKLPPEVSLVEGSCQKSPELNVDGLHVRVRLKVGQCSEAQDSAVQHLSTQTSYCFLCQSCGAMLLKDRPPCEQHVYTLSETQISVPYDPWQGVTGEKLAEHSGVFRRVLPLPNGNWNTLVDDWCCHADPFANKKLLPHEEDCLLGDTYFLLTRDSGCDQSLKNAADLSDGNPGSNLQCGKQALGHRNVVVCKNCCAVLGEAVTREVLKFYITEVVVRQSQDEEFRMPQNRQQFLERALGSKLVELSSAQSIFRFSIQTPDAKAVIMLWLLNMDTLIATFPEKAISNDILICASDHHPNKHQSCQAVKAIKVLYLPCTHGQKNEAVDAWEKDISVHPLILPRSTCEELLKLLSSSTTILPSSLCSMNYYQVAYLRR